MAESTEESTPDAAAVERVEQFAVSPEELWDAITDPDLLAEWFGPVEIDLSTGGAITDREPDGATIGVVETVERPHRIGFVWLAPGSDAPSSVELVIDGDGDGTEDDDTEDYDTEDAGGSVLYVREVLIQPRWETPPAWLAAPPRACASSRA
ncbi:MAG: hypothetical protein QOH10_2849 [Actinomycetota bacterium]|nr:hypothetical protein [Actinomycetota bacterium]